MDENQSNQDEQMEETKETSAINPILNIVRGLVGMGIGGVVGVWLFEWILTQGLYAIVLPGLFIGLGCGVLIQSRCILLQVIAGISGVSLGIYCDWKHTLGYSNFFDYLKDFHHNPPIVIILIVLGGVFSFWYSGKSLVFRDLQAK